MFAACAQSTPLVPVFTAMSWLVMPTPMIEPISVWELELGQPEVPRAQIPDDRRYQQRENHGEARAAAHLQNQLHRQQRDDPEGHRTARKHYSQKIKESRPDHGDVRFERMRIDYRGDRVGRVVKAVHELESQRGQQCHAQQ